ncbi:VanW family protein [Alkalicoccobacillus gibsonii]|uniref:VanW family protein n=1 Tax=Alkalicoccobacillus gibsonii TaxID=79881 RepID=A0ABU9VHS6_9BACI
MRKWSLLICVSVASVSLLIACQSEPTQIVSKQLPLKEESKRLHKERMVWDELDLIDHQENTFTVSLADLGFSNNDLTTQINEEAIVEFASDLASTIDTPMKNPTIDEFGNITAGESRVILSEKELIEHIHALSPRTKRLQLPIYVTEPTVSSEQLEGIDEYEVASFRTYFDSSVEGRTKNIQISADAINQYVLGPGDQFSFNKVVGERTKERGYEEALEIVNKEFVLGIGGGICQTSSTLFNAIDAAGLEVVHRYTHSRDVGYVASGRDATVSWGGPDFVFENSLDQPVMIKAEVNQGELVVNVVSNAP